MWRTGRSIVASKARFKAPPKTNHREQENRQSVVIVTDQNDELVGIGNNKDFSNLIPKLVFNALG